MMFVPVATPVVYLRRESFDGDQFGEITPSDSVYDSYLKVLKESIANTYVKIVLPGAP